MQNHPDPNSGDPEAAKKFKQVRRAYEAWPEQRRETQSRKDLAHRRELFREMCIIFSAFSGPCETIIPGKRNLNKEDDLS